MSSKEMSFSLRELLAVCMAAGLVALAAALTAPDAAIAFLHKVANRVIENIEWLALLPANHAERFFLPYLVLSFGVAFLVVRREASEPLDWRALFARVFPRAVYWHRSARIDYGLVLTDRVFTPAMLGTRLFSTAAFAGWIATQLNAMLGERPPLLSGTAALLVFTLLFALSSDLADYLQHRMHHASKLLWQFHKLHHSAEVLTPLTIFRVHPVEQMLGAIVTTLVVGCVTGISSHWLIEQPQPITFLGTQLLMLFVYTCCAVHLRHSHVWLSWSPALSHLVISPAQHQIHHSAAVRHWDKNYGNVLALWDWLFGSLYIPRAREELTFGLQGSQPHPTLIAAYLEPPAAAWRVLRARLSRSVHAVRRFSAFIAQRLTTGRSSGLSGTATTTPEQLWDPGDLPVIVRDQSGLGVLITLESVSAHRVVRFHEVGEGTDASAAARGAPGR
jgi:sterol desaturase/sphingolipid hydroxylase (fatty acid hydroxylase superfamily)